MDIDLPTTELKRLTKEAEAAGYSSPEAYTEALLMNKLVQQQERNAYHVAVEAGLIDDAHILPNDLATNPERMEGFGVNRTEAMIERRAAAVSRLRGMRASLPKMSTEDILDAVADARCDLR